MLEDATQPSDWSRLVTLGRTPRSADQLVLPDVTLGDLRPPGSVPGEHHHALTIEVEWETLAQGAPFVTRYFLILCFLPLSFLFLLLSPRSIWLIFIFSYSFSSLVTIPWTFGANSGA